MNQFGGNHQQSAGTGRSSVHLEKEKAGVSLRAGAGMGILLILQKLVDGLLVRQLCRQPRLGSGCFLPQSFGLPLDHLQLAMLLQQPVQATIFVQLIVKNGSCCSGHEKGVVRCHYLHACLLKLAADLQPVQTA